jgi:hypothetical protein
MHLKHKSITSEEARLIESYAKKCMKLLMKKEYELDIPRDAQHRIPITIRKRKNSPSRGGPSGIDINLGYWQIGNQFHTEYKAFNDDKTIGKIECGGVTENHLMVTVAHEIAHYVQYRYAHRVPRFKGKWQKPHGEAFRTIYRYLRQDLVNGSIAQSLENKNFFEKR